MTLDFQSLRPEDEELARLKARLDDLEEELADRELDLATRRRELEAFRLRFVAAVGPLLAELDSVVARVAALLAQKESTPEAQQAAEAASQRARESAEALGDDPEGLSEEAAKAAVEPSPDLKKLFRSVAKAVHPDLASDDEERLVREALMARANAAYEAGDEEALRAVLRDWSANPQAVSGDGVGAELVRTIRAVAAAEGRLLAIGAELAGLDRSELADLHSRWLVAEGEGRDMLAEMQAQLRQDIDEACARLADLQNGAKAGGAHA
jgi:hypothetical protein